MKVLIVGGGIAGLAVAAHLSRRGITPTIIEQAPKWLHKGFVLGIWGKGLGTLSSMTTKEQLDSIGYKSTVFTIRNRNGKVIKHLNFSHLVHKYGLVILTHRATFHELLQSLTSNIPITFDTSITQLTQDKRGVRVTFSDNKQDIFDVVIGADGIHSTVRKLLFGKELSTYSGLRGWIYTAPSTVPFPKNASEMWVGDRFFGVYPDKEARLCTIFAEKMPKDVSIGSFHVTYLKHRFSDFKWIVPKVLASMNDESEIHFDNWDKVHLDTWTVGRVALIGDAAHASPPATGMGASMALEDALVLASELTANADNPQTALATYQHKRRQHVHMIQRQSEWIEMFKYADSQPYLFLRDTFLRYIPSGAIVRDFEYMLR